MKKKIIIIIVIFVSLLIIAMFFLLQKDIKLTLNDKALYYNNINIKYNEPGYKACYGYKYIFKDKCKDITNSVKLSGIVDETNKGSYYLTYTVKYKDKEKKLTRRVVVADIEKPVITLVDYIGKICPSGEFKEPGYTAIDNIDGDLTSKVITSIKDSSIIYEVTDSSGNTGIVERKAVFIDDEAPNITLKGYQTEYLQLGTNYKESGYTAIDNCDLDLTNKVNIENNVNVNTSGLYKVTYTVVDNSNNKKVVTRDVKVYKKPESKVVMPSDKTIYLTFDDGPGAYTNRLLDILDYYDVKATFFIMYRSNYRSTIKRAHDSGHSIGLHTTNHVYKSVYASVGSFFNDINKLNNLVYDVTGEKSKLIRFPGGSGNTVSKFNPGIMTALSIEVQEAGYQYFDWNVSGADTSLKDSNAIANQVIKNLGNKKYYIVLQHDIKKASVEAVPLIIEYGLKNGYTFAPLNVNSPTIHSKINN